MEYTLIYTLIASIVVAFLFGMVARQMQLPAIFGYLLAGIAIGPNTPGFVADLSLAKQLAEIGIILLMFGVGLHFSLKELKECQSIALPGAIAQMLCATLVGGVVGISLGYDPLASFLFGFSLSVASTIVLIRALEQHKLVDTRGGKIAISWLIVEDIAMVLALVMLPVIVEVTSGTQEFSARMVMVMVMGVLFKVGGFIAFMVLFGRRFLPWILVHTSRTRSDELETLCSLAIALGFALIAYQVFDASLALGAFFAGVMMNESKAGKKTADNSVQMRDTFSVLFFVSVGMLCNPHTMLEQPVALLLTFLNIVVAKSLAALAFTLWCRQPREVGYTVALGLAQIGEFSFILGGLSLSRGLIDQELYDLILAGAILSIVVNPFLFRLYDFLVGKPRKKD